MTTAQEAAPVLAAVRGRTTPSWIGWLVPPATILVILVGSVLLLMTPLWMHYAITGTTAGLFATPQLAIDASDPTVHDLLFGGDFYIDVGGGHQLFTPDEVSHLRDARLVLDIFLALAVVSLTVLAWAISRRGRDSRTWQAVARGGAMLAIGTLVLGVFALVAFEAAFELFHRVFFPGGNWQFSSDSWLIRLYPFAFWQITSLALGLLCIAGGSVAWFIGRRRATQLAARP